MFAYKLPVKQILDHAKEWGFNPEDWKGLPLEEE